MRIGSNPRKQDNTLQEYGRHRVIIPVYIPNQEGYFAHSLEVLKLCLESLRLTAAGKANVTVVANGCAPAVIEELDRQYRKGWIDQLLLNRANRGKVDAVLSVARGCFERVITISDCDVLFKPGWLEAIEQVFQCFPECGFASPFPNPPGIWYHTSATIFGAFTRRELRFAKVVSDADLAKQAQSFGTPDRYTEKHKKAQLTVQRNGTTVCVGGGHFVFTTRREVVAGMPPQPSLTAISESSDRIWLDAPPDRLGYWRLGTTRSYVYHIGNDPEPWLYAEIEKYRRGAVKVASAPAEFPAVRRHWTSRLPWSWRVLLLRAIRKFVTLRQRNHKTA